MFKPASVIKRLRNRFGTTISITNFTTTATNYTTGVETKTSATVTGVRAIVVQAVSAKKFAYDIAYLAANTNFTYGGLFNRRSYVVVLLKSDYSGTLTSESIITFGNNTYQIDNFIELNDASGYIINIRASK